MVKPARLGSSVGMTLAHDAGGASPRRSTLAFRYDDLSRSSRPTSPARATSRSRSSATTRALEMYGPGRDRRRPRVLRLRRQVHAGPVRDLDPRPRSPTPARARMHKLVARRVSGDRRGGLRARRLPARRRRASYLSEINTIPGFTPISLFPTMPAEGGYTSPPSASGSSSWPSSATPRAAAPAPDAGGPAPMSRPARSPAGSRHADRRGAGAPGPSAAPRPACPPSAPGPRSRCSCRRRAIYGVGASTAFDVRASSRSTASCTPTGRGRGRPRRRAAARTCSGSRPARSQAAIEALPTVARRARRRPPARDPGRRPSTSASRSSSGRSVTGAGWSTPTASCSPGSATSRRRPRRCRSSTTAGRRRPCWPSGRTLDAGRPRRGDPAGLARAGRRRQLGGRAWPSRSPTRTASSSTTSPAAGRRSSASTRRACGRPS